MTANGRNTRIQAVNRNRILDAAQEIFAEFGFRGATVDRIAQRAGMSKPNLHYYFKRKSDLYYTVLQRILTIWLEPLEELDPSADPRVELTRYIGLKLKASRDHPSASKVFANEMLHGAPVLKTYLETDLKQLVERKTRVIRTWIDAGRLADIDPHSLIFLIWAATQHYADFAVQVHAILGRDQLDARDYGRIQRSLCAIILDGIIAD
jgi:TetR/AcrR family transcriptional regulator